MVNNNLITKSALVACKGYDSMVSSFYRSVGRSSNIHSFMKSSPAMPVMTRNIPAIRRPNIFSVTSRWNDLRPFNYNFLLRLFNYLFFQYFFGYFLAILICNSVNDFLLSILSFLLYFFFTLIQFIGFDYFCFIAYLLFCRFFFYSDHIISRFIRRNCNFLINL